jgi:hypothetical protein
VDVVADLPADTKAGAAEVVEGGSYRRAFVTPVGPAVATVGPADGSGVVVGVAGPAADADALERAVELATRAFGLDQDPSELTRLSRPRRSATAAGNACRNAAIRHAHIRRHLGRQQPGERLIEQRTETLLH